MESDNSTPSDPPAPTNDYNGSSFAISSGAVTTDTLDVTDAGTITDLNVTISATNAWDIGYYSFKIISPYGTVVDLVNIPNPAEGLAFNNTTFDDEATNTLSSEGQPYFDSFQPAGDLSDVDQEEMQGEWILWVYNSSSSSSASNIVSAWSITLEALSYSGPVWHVSTTGSDSNDGSESSPFATIQTAIDSSSDGDTVLVQAGTYVENINFNGKNIVVGSLYLTTQDTSYISSTIIDGNQSGSVVKFVSGEDTTAVLTGLTITNGLGGLNDPEEIKKKYNINTKVINGYTIYYR